MSAWMTLGIVFLSAAGATTPPVQWTHEMASNPYAPPLVADMHENPGQEIIAVDSESRTVYCLSGQGAVLWEAQIKADAPLRGVAALGQGRERGAWMLAIPADSSVAVLDAATGAARRQLETGPIGLGGGCWVDLRGDDSDALVVSTAEDGVLAFDADGVPLWSYTAEDHDGELRINGAPAAADVDEDGIPELFFVAENGPFCLDADGNLQWRGESGDRFLGAAIIAPPDSEGVPRLYCVSVTPPALQAFDAGTGDALWQTPLEAAPDDVSANAAALADLDFNERIEILLSDAEGRVYAMSASGAVLWTYRAEASGAAAIAIGDVTGDGGLDVLVAAADNMLHCLDRAGTLQWRYTAGGPLLHAPALADVNGDRQTQILFGAGDRVFRSLGPDAPHIDALMPWPAARGGAARQGRPDLRELFERDEGALELIPDNAQLLQSGSFELPAPGSAGADAPRPAGWTLESGAGTWALDESVKFAGKSALKMQPENESIVVASESIGLSPDLRHLNASVMVQGVENARAILQWRSPDGIVREDAFTARGAASDAWRRHVLHQAHPPLDATAFRVLLRVDASGDAVWWDEAQAEGAYERVPLARAFVNQAGYEIGAPKRFTVWSSFPARSGHFAVTTPSGQSVHQGTLSGGERLIGAFNSDWGGYYWQGDFSAFDVPGSYKISVELEGAKALSPTFALDKHALWDNTMFHALRAFALHRCGTTVPGRNAPCHMDDACGERSLAGGWHDGSTHDKTNAMEYLWILVNAYGTVLWRIDAAGSDSQPGVAWRQEIKWGAQLALNAVDEDGSVCPMPASKPDYCGAPELETDNQPGTGDERPPAANGQDSAMYCAAALARLARLLPEDNAPYLDAAQRIIDKAAKEGWKGPMLFSAAMDIYQITKSEEMRQHIREWYPGADPACAEAVVAYDELDIIASFDLAMALQAKADAYLARANNPFGVCARNDEERADFFGTDAAAPEALMGNTLYVLEAAHIVAQAYRFKPSPEYAVFIYDQLNWILGNNPFGISLMEGMGTHFPPSYAYCRGENELPRNALSGIIVHGIRGNAPGDERPAFDLSGQDNPDPRSNAYSLRANAQWLSAIANLKRIRMGE